MNTKTFIAATGNGICRAELGVDRKWSLEQLLAGGDVRCLAVDPLDSTIVYAGTQGQGLLRSRDRGRTWQPAGLDGEVVKSIVASPLIPGRLYAGARPACIFTSDNSGGAWREIESFQRVPNRWWWFSPAEPPFKAYVQSIALSPRDPQVVLAGVEFGAVVLSQDGGQTWSSHRQGALRDCHSLAFHASDGDWAYEAGVSGAGAAFSQDGGRTWQQPRRGLDRHYGWACAADPRRPEIWYISASAPFSFPQMVPAAHIDGRANAGIYRCQAGNSWQRLAGGLPQPLDYMAYVLLTDPDESGHLYAGLSNGDVWFSSDYGDSWLQLPFNLGSVQRTMLML